MPWATWPHLLDPLLTSYFVFLQKCETLQTNRETAAGWTVAYLVYSILVILGVLVAIIIAITISYVRLKKRVDDKYKITTSSPPMSILSCAYSASRSSLSGFTEPDITGVHTSFHGKHIKNLPFRSNARIKGMSSGGSDVPGLSPHKKYQIQDNLSMFMIMWVLLCIKYNIHLIKFEPFQ